MFSFLLSGRLTRLFVVVCGGHFFLYIQPPADVRLIRLFVVVCVGISFASRSCQASVYNQTPTLQPLNNSLQQNQIALYGLYEKQLRQINQIKGPIKTSRVLLDNRSATAPRRAWVGQVWYRL